MREPSLWYEMCTGLRIVFVHMESDPATVEIFLRNTGSPQLTASQGRKAGGSY